MLGEQPDDAAVTVASDSTNGSATSSAPTDAVSDAKQDVTVTNDANDTDDKANGSSSSTTTMERQEDATPTKSDANKDGDMGINHAVPIIGVAIVGGAVVVYASKRKRGGNEDSADAASKQ